MADDPEAREKQANAAIARTPKAAVGLLKGLAGVFMGAGSLGYAVGAGNAHRPKEAIEGACNEVGPGGVRCARPDSKRAHKIHRGVWGTYHVEWQKR